MVELIECKNREEWDDDLLENQGHPFQLWGWGEVKAVHGWKTERLIIKNNDEIIGFAQVLTKKLPWPPSTCSISSGSIPAMCPSWAGSSGCL